MASSQNDTTSVAETGLPENWKASGGGDVIHRRFEFETYAKTSAFLEALANVSEEAGLYPDLSFAKTYANVTLPTGEDESATKAAHDFAVQANKIYKDQD